MVKQVLVRSLGIHAYDLDPGHTAEALMVENPLAGPSSPLSSGSSWARASRTK